MNGVNTILDSRPSGERLFAFIVAAVLSAVFVLVVILSRGNRAAILAFPLVSFLLVLQARFELALSALVVCLFVDIHVSFFSSAVVYSFLFGIAFFLRSRDIRWSEFSNPMTVPIILYGLCVIPSFFNAVQPLMCAYKLLNVFSFLIVMYVVVGGLRSYDNARRMVAVYIGAAALNGVVVIWDATHQVLRPFGPAGIMFGDYAGLGVCVALVMTALSRGRDRLIAGSLALLLCASLVLTQIRNAWIATFVTLVICGVYIVFRSGSLGLPRREVFRTVMIGGLFILLVSAAVVGLAPRVGTRAAGLGAADFGDIDEHGLIHNSLISRAFIWDAALSAFRDHPFIGVGVYGFPDASAMYTRLPSTLYNYYVARNSPHQTHFAVLSETGIVGAIGYLLFLIAGIRSAFGAIRTSRDDRERRYAVVGMAAFMYIVVSMTFTDAWLWGQGIVLLGLSLGGLLALRKINSPSPESGVRA